MPRRGRIRAASALLATAALVLAVPSVALADGPGPTPSPTASKPGPTRTATPKPTPKPTGTARPRPSTAPKPSTTPKPGATPKPKPTLTPEQAAEARRLGARIVALQRTAEEKGKVAQKATERAHDAQAHADDARRALTEATAAADAATAEARRSRARASAVAAKLARTDVGTLPLSLMLNARSADGVLDGLSSASQLAVQSQLLYQQAERDRKEARRLEEVAKERSTAAAAAAAKAAEAAKTAKRDAASAEKAVQAALDEQRALLRRLATEGIDGCADVGDAPVSACLPTGNGTDPAPVHGHSVGAEVLRFAVQQIGKPYVFGADGPRSYDCSGLTLTAYATAGVSIGIHSATAQYRLARSEGDLVSVAEARPGDLLFYTDGGGDMYHVTIYAGDDLMIEAPYPGATVREAPVRTQDLAPLAAHFG